MSLNLIGLLQEILIKKKKKVSLKLGSSVQRKTTVREIKGKSNLSRSRKET